ncbi:MAG: flippase [Chloroflexi bacterium]|nr:flippase [Chloroflexota bacterium]MCI0578393.1 flippase [Chloroflexota bacterium]MCI0647610.1 flippase [Chloroflexota bacterium]MCI0730421.1 flippase [Chloroflexota bacterium]
MSIRARRIGRNLAAMSAAQLFSRSFAFLTTIHLARSLGVENFGVIVFALTVLSYAELVVQAGLHRLGPREIARDESRLASLAQAILTLRLGLAVAALALLAVFVWLWSGSSLEKQVVLTYGLVLFFLAFDLGWVFMALEMMGVIAAAEIVSQALMLAAVLLLVHDPADALRVPLIYLIATGCNMAILAVVYVRRFGRFRLGLDRVVWRPLVRATLPLAVSTAMGAVTFNFDTLMLGLMRGAEAVGLYGAAYRIVWVPSVAAVAYFVALFPSLDRAYAHGLATVSDLLSRSIRLTAIVGLGLGVAGVLLARPGFDLIYGPDFRPAVLPFQLLIWSIVLLFLNRNYRVLLVSFDQQQVELKVITGAAVTNVILNLAFIPRWGLAGAAVATVASELFILGFGYLYTRQRIGPVPLFRHLPRPALAAAVMGLVLLLTSQLHVLFRAVIGAGVYVAALLVVQAITPAEIQLAYQIFRPGKTPPEVQAMVARPPGAIANLREDKPE